VSTLAAGEADLLDASSAPERSKNGRWTGVVSPCDMQVEAGSSPLNRLTTRVSGAMPACNSTTSSVPPASSTGPSRSAAEDVECRCPRRRRAYRLRRRRRRRSSPALPTRLSDAGAAGRGAWLRCRQVHTVCGRTRCCSPPGPCRRTRRRSAAGRCAGDLQAQVPEASRCGSHQVLRRDVRAQLQDVGAILVLDPALR